jgi:hypothetical protein
MGCVVSFVPWSLCPGEIASGTHWIGSCVGPRSGLDSVTGRIYLPCHYGPASSLVTKLTELFRLHLCLSNKMSYKFYLFIYLFIYFSLIL